MLHVEDRLSLKGRQGRQQSLIHFLRPWTTPKITGDDALACLGTVSVMALVCRLLSARLQLDFGGCHRCKDAHGKAEPACKNGTSHVESVHMRRRAQRPSSGSGEAPRVSSRVCHWKVHIFCKTINSVSRESGVQEITNLHI